jgi:RHS repeat-associated protein
MYAYKQAGLTSGKRLRVQEIFNWYKNGNPGSSTQKLDLDATYTYATGGEGKVLSVTYPTTYNWNSGTSQLVPTTGPTYTYGFDAMMRPTGLTDQSNNTDVSNVTYNAANQLLGLNYLGTAETRQYNNLNQMTNLTAGSGINITYTFPAGANNGKISQQTNSVSGETVTYQYDSLNRLLSATSSQSWSETYGYDGFGNLLSKTPTGGAPTLSQSVIAATNQIVGLNYDANGNQLSGGYGYDAENRLVTASGIQYGYDSRNKRVWSGVMSGSTVTQTVYFYGVGGQRLGIYSFTTPPSSLGSPELSDGAKSLAVYFGGKRVVTVTNGTTYSFTQDRLGSNGTYYPYGEARGTVPQDDVGFATYTNDSATGLQYADQRYYANNFGRFMSPDVFSGKSRSPRSWNRYSYVNGDPTNSADPDGRVSCNVDGGDVPCDLVSSEDLVSGDGSGGGPADPAEVLLIAIFMQYGGLSPFGILAGGPPAPGKPTPSCQMNVKIDGAPRNQSIDSAPAPSNGQLGPFEVPSGQDYAGWYFAFQIRGNLYGDTNPQDWMGGQWASASGSGTAVFKGNNLPVSFNNPLEWDAADPTNTNTSTAGQYDWIDSPGPFMPYYLPNGAVAQVVSANITYSFYSYIWNPSGGRPCDVGFSLHLSLSQGVATWTFSQ